MRSDNKCMLWISKETQQWQHSLWNATNFGYLDCGGARTSEAIELANKNQKPKTKEREEGEMMAIKQFVDFQAVHIHGDAAGSTTFYCIRLQLNSCGNKRTYSHIHLFPGNSLIRIHTHSPCVRKVHGWAKWNEMLNINLIITTTTGTHVYAYVSCSNMSKIFSFSAGEYAV